MGKIAFAGVNAAIGLGLVGTRCHGPQFHDYQT